MEPLGRNMRRRVATGFLAGVLLVGVLKVSASSQGEDAPGSIRNVAVVEAELAELRDQRAALREELAGENSLFFRFKHDVVYTNSPVGLLYREIVELEKQLVAKRRALQEVEREMPELKAMTERRKALHARIRRLSEREQLLRNELRALRLREAADAAPAE